MVRARDGAIPGSADADASEARIEAEVLRRLDAARSADAAAAWAYAWAKRHGPLLFGLPRSGVVLEGFADAVRRIERVKPGSIARALESRMARGRSQAALGDALVRRVQFRRGGGGPAQMPGGGFQDLTPGEELRVAEFGQLLVRLRRAEPDNPQLQYLAAPNTVPSEEWIARLRGEVAAAEERAQLGQPPRVMGTQGAGRGGAGEQSQAAPGGKRLEFQDWDKSEKSSGARDLPGTATNSAPLAPVTGQWLRGTEGNAGMVPGQIADKLRGQHFNSFDEFRASFWKAVAGTPELSVQF